MTQNLKSSKYHITSTKLPLKESQIEYIKSHESLISKDATVKRKNEFLAGRWCAVQSILNYKSSFNGIIKRGKNNEPIWPNGFTGSISHSRAMAIGVVSNQSILIGIDIEKIVNLKKIEVIKKMTLTLEESEILEHEDEKEKLATLIFSAKESLYKMLNPVCKCYINFHEGIFTTYDFATGTYQIELRSSKPELKAYLGIYSGQFALINDNIVTISYCEI